MKKYIKIFLYGGLLFLLGSVFPSCESYLDKEPESDVHPDDAFMNFYNFQGFVEELYHCIPDFTNQQYNNSFNWGEEEHYSPNGVNQGIIISKFDQGNYWGWQREMGGDTWLDRWDFSTNDDRWEKALYPMAWYGISKANLGIENLEKMAGSQEEKDLIEGQLYFFRGWFYFQLIQYFGGLPYIDHVIDVTQKIEYPRESYYECVEKIAKDLQHAADLLPNHWNEVSVHPSGSIGNDVRINRIMALAFLGKNYLWAGSPLMHKTATGSETYNEAYCKKAADVFAEILAMSEAGDIKHKLAKFGNTKFLDWFETDFNKKYGNTYMQLYVTVNRNVPGLDEAIFVGPYWGGTGWSMHQQYLAANILMGRSWSFYPTANYANYFGMANGKPINEFIPGEGYLCEDSNSESGYNSSYPWTDRDPRFYLVYGFDTQRMVESSMPSSEEGWRHANLYTYDPSDDATTYRNPVAGSTTGYLLNKYNPYGFNRYDGAWANDIIKVSWVRLADVYLMYAEAVAMGYKDINHTVSVPGYSFSLTPVEAVNKIRDRANVGLIDSKYLFLESDPVNGTDVGFMSELRRERAVELAFEGHRFNDLRRWLLLTKAPYTYKKAIEFTRKSKTRYNKNDPTKNEVLNLKEVMLLERKFDDKHYWLPLKKADTYMYLEFEQNPGW